MLRVLTLATLFPDRSRPNFGPFVALQTQGLAAHPDIELRVVAPVGLPPLARLHPRYAALSSLPFAEDWHGLPTYRPRFVHVPGPGARFDAVAIVRALKPMLATLRGEFAFDVIDAQFFWPDGAAAVHLGRVFGVPVSVKARGADIHYWGAHPAIGKLVAEAGRGADGILAVSEALKSDMIALGMPGDRIRVHRTGVDRTLFHVRPRQDAKRALGIAGPLLVSVGNLITRKGHACVIDAIARLPDVCLVIIGDGDQRSALSGQIARLGLGSRVTLLGSQPHATIAHWLAAADAMLLMSLSEGLANAWVEALASGTPLVIADAGGAREIVDRPEAGEIVAADPNAVANAITRVLLRNADRETVAATVADYSWSRNAQALYAHLAALKAAAAQR